MIEQFVLQSSSCNADQGRIQPARLGGAAILVIFGLL